MVKLDRCPFCNTISAYERIQEGEFSVVCRGRGCRAIGMQSRSGDRDETGKSWNRRTSCQGKVRPGALAPCPFCGGSVSSSALKDGVFRCQSCGMMVSFPSAETPDENAALWSRRVR